MTSSRRSAGEQAAEAIEHVRPLRPLHFPASDPEWEMSESHRHGRLCELLYQLLRSVLDVDDASVGADHFVYFDASNPSRKCAPDGFVKLAVPAESIEVWKTWEQGVPELCVEILSPSDTKEKLTLPEKLKRFHTMGVKEVISFNVDAPVGRRIRAWDLIHGDLIERVVQDERTRCLTLDHGTDGPPRWFVVAPYEAEGRASVDRLPAALRLAEETAGGLALLPTPDERDIARRKAAEQRAKEEHARAEQERTRAEQERTRAEQERTRAEQERTRAERAEALAQSAEQELARLREALLKER